MHLGQRRFREQISGGSSITTTAVFVAITCTAQDSSAEKHNSRRDTELLCSLPSPQVQRAVFERSCLFCICTNGGHAWEFLKFLFFAPLSIVMKHAWEYAQCVKQNHINLGNG